MVTIHSPARVPWGVRGVARFIDAACTALLAAVPRLHLCRRRHVWASTPERLERYRKTIEAAGFEFAGSPTYGYVPEADRIAWSVGVRRRAGRRRRFGAHHR